MYGISQKITGQNTKPVQSKDTNNRAKGDAGEYLALFELCMNEIVAHKITGASYDIIVNYSDSLIKVQCKTGHHPQSWRTKKKFTDRLRFKCYKGSKSKTQYSKNEVDIYAFADLDQKVVAWVNFKDVNTSLVIMKDSFDKYDLNKCLSEHIKTNQRG